jgi:CDC45-like protein
MGMRVDLSSNLIDLVAKPPCVLCLISAHSDASFFCQPLALIRLALFLASTYQESRAKSDLPVVLAAHHVVRDTFLVVGVSSEAATIDERK